MMKGLILFAGAAIVAAQPALATSGVYCQGVTETSVSAYLITGSTPGFGIVKADIQTPVGVWSTEAETEAEAMVLVQASISGAVVVADFADGNVEYIVASLRLIRVETDDGVTSAGVLSLPDGNAWPVVCDFG